MIKILSIDGGGIRGIIPATVLAEIENRTHKPIAKLFDLIAGTSTGGILAAGLTKPNHDGHPQYNAQDIVNLYEHEGKTIFYQSLFHKINTFNNLLEAKYTSDGIEKVLSRYFGNTYLHEVVTDVLIPSYEIERRVAFFFKSSHAKKEKNRNFLLKHVARATSAAPTYFPPEKIPTQDLSEYFALVDGAVYANNPAMCAFVEAKTMFPKETKFLVVSLGTGELTKPIFYNKAKVWGVAQWAQPILDVVFDGVNDTVDYQLKQLLPTEENSRRYYRFQVRLNEGNDNLDNISQTNIRALKLYGEAIIRDNNEAINTLCQQLTS
jgi:patatin-like phospholipase/acyl hydrolase